MVKSFLFIALLFAAPPAMAADEVSLDSKVYVERHVATADGKSKIVREDPKLIVPGEKLLFVLEYKNIGTTPAERFVVTNPIPNSVAYVATDSPGAEESVDGGKNWGSLGSLEVKGANGSLRPAITSDVTHIRWILTKPIAIGEKGSLSFRGVVR